MILDEEGHYVRNTLIENLQNCYLLYSNRTILDNLDNHEVLFMDYDLQNIQGHICELSDEKTKDKFLANLIEMMRK